MKCFRIYEHTTFDWRKGKHKAFGNSMKMNTHVIGEIRDGLAMTRIIPIHEALHKTPRQPYRGSDYAVWGIGRTERYSTGDLSSTSPAVSNR